MKKKYATFLKISCGVFATSVIVVGIPCSMFFFDSGRQILLNGATKFLEHKGVHCEIQGVARDLSKIDFISIKISENFTLSASGISIKKEYAKFDICANKVVFKSTDSGQNFRSNQSDKSNNMQIELPFAYIKMARTFLNKLEINDVLIDVPNRKYSIKKFSYLHVRSIDKFSCNLHYSGSENFLNLQLNWGTFRCEKAEISFQNIEGFDGSLALQYPEKKTSDYKLYLSSKAKNFELNSYGKVQLDSRKIYASEVLLAHNGETYKTSGNAVINADCVDAKMSIECNDYVKKYNEKTSDQVRKNFENVTVNINAKYFFKDDARHELIANFERNKEYLGRLYGKIFDKQINICGDINWIDFYGYKLKSLDCKISNFKNIFATIGGDDFCIKSSVKINGNILVESAILEVPNNGFLRLDQPVIVSKNSNLSTSFQFQKLDFFQKIAPLSGDLKGTFSRNNQGNFWVSVSGSKLKILDYEASDYTVIKNNKQQSLSARNISCFGVNFHDIFLNIASNNLQMSTRALDKAVVNASGKISNSFKKISLDSCSITVPDNIDNARCNIKNFVIDFEKNEHSFTCELSNKKLKVPGYLKLRSNNGSTKIELSDFRVGILRGILRTGLPKWCLNGTINLQHPNGISESITGDGHVVVADFLCQHNLVELRAKFGNNIQLNGSIKSVKDTMLCDISIPMSIAKVITELQKNSRAIPLNCHIFGSNRLEHLFELPDGNDMRGLFKCDLKISGNFSSPRIDGNATLQDAHFVIGDIFLRRGNIGLVCCGDNITIANAEFTDNRNRRFAATGGGKFFCEGCVPNIKTDLNLVCDDYTLFDSEDLRIRIKGKGKITGPIDDLLISGKVEATKCVVQNMDTETEDANGGIIISNERNSFKKKQKWDGGENKEKDFCKYDIDLHCPRVDVIGNLYELRFTGDLQLLTYEGVASLSGSLQLKHGKLDLFGKKMMVRKGKAEFFEQYPFDPRLSILFYNSFGDMVVYLKVKNVPQKGGSFDLYSVPSSSTELILSNMLFGKDLKNLSVSEAAQFAQAMASFKKNGGLFAIMNGLKKTGIVDTISFSTADNEATKSLNTNSQTSKSSGNINVTAGKYIGDKVFISVNKKSDNTTSFDIDYAITPKISVKANTNGEAGINWRYRY